jgi:oxygen-independent coproporphyrinogen-3 oxidase
MVNAIAKEIALKKGYLSEKSLETIYFGGGSPSILSPAELEILFTTIQESFDLSSLKEVTLEANPDDIHIDKLNEWYNLGINRLSLGIQTFDEVYLKFMNRAHNAKEAIFALETILNRGFETSSADLIYAKTGLHLNEKRQAEILKKDIEILSRFDLKHISAYNLTIEEDTVFGKWAAKQKLAAIPDDYAAEQYKIVTDSLGELGFEQYEISNFAREEKYAVHNTSYWMGDEYLGVGPSAHSFNDHSRQWNISNNHKYMEGIEQGYEVFEKENLTVNDKINEYLLTGLRTIWGVSIDKIHAISLPTSDEFHKKIEELKSQELLTQEGNVIIIPPHARILSDKIASDLFWE